MSPVHLCVVAVFTFFTITEQSNLALKELENILKNLAAQITPKNQATNSQRYSGLEHNSKFDNVQSPKYLFLDDLRTQQQLENDLQKAVEFESDRICKITGRCGCSAGRGRCGRSNRMLDKTVIDMDMLLNELNKGLNREQNKNRQGVQDRHQKYNDRRERQANNQKIQEYGNYWKKYDDRRQKQNDRKYEYNDRRQDQDERITVYDEYKRWEEDEGQQYNDKQQRNNDKQLVYMLQEYDDGRQKYDDERQRQQDDRQRANNDERQEYDEKYAEKRKQRSDKLRLYGYKRQEYDDLRLQQGDRRLEQGDRRQEYDEYKRREDDDNQRYDEKQQKTNDKQLVYILQDYDDVRQEYRDKRQEQEDRQQEYNDRRQQLGVRIQEFDEDQQYSEKRKLLSDLNRIYGSNIQEYDVHKQQQNDRRQKQDDRRQEYDDDSDEFKQTLKTAANNDKNSDINIVIFEDSNAFQNRDENEKLMDINDLRIQNMLQQQKLYALNDKNKQRPDSLSLEEFVKYYGKIKKKITNGLLSYVKGFGGGMYLSQLLPYQKKQLNRLKSTHVKKPLTDEAIKTKIVQLLFGMMGNIKLLPHSKDDQTIYIPNPVYEAISLYNENNLVRSNKRLIPLTLQQKNKKKQLNGHPKFKFSKNSWRRNNQEIPNYGVPFDLQVQGLGQIN